MTDLATIVFGPLVVPECRRSAGRGWIILVRTLAGSATVVTLLGFMWWWWFAGQDDWSYSPFSLLRAALQTIVFMAIAIALVMAPAVLAGSLAGDKERGSMGLLLTTRVNALEIVAGRLAGKLCQIGIIVATGIPALVWVAVLAGIGPLAFGVLLLLPAAVAFGAGGVAVGFSGVARRGREALFGSYLVVVFLLLGPLVTGPGWLRPEFGLFNPFVGLSELAWEEAVGPALVSIGLWSSLGLLGTAVAAWRLRPSCLNLLGGDSRRGRRSGRRWRVPPLAERDAMLWKELFIERAGSLGRIGRWLGLLLIGYLVLASTILAGLALHAMLVRGDNALADYYIGKLGEAVSDPRTFLLFLIQMAIGLRGAVAISSERERGTWDALLTSPLSGREIIWGKLWGSLHALAWLLLAALWAWSLAVSLGAMTVTDFAYTLASLLTIGTFMGAVGIRASLATATATRAMAITAGVWLGALAVISVVTALVLVIVMVSVMLAQSLGTSLGLVMPAPFGAWVGRLWSIGWIVLYPTFYAVLAALLMLECRLRFDRIAGRMAGDAVAVRVEHLLHGPPMAPVPLEPLAIQREGAAAEPA